MAPRRSWNPQRSPIQHWQSSSIPRRSIMCRFFFILMLMALPGSLWAGGQDLYEKATFSAGGEKLLYRVLKPAQIDPGKKYPLVLFLHGAGERGDNNAAQLVHG